MSRSYCLATLCALFIALPGPHAQTVEHSKRNYIMGNKADLPHDGWLVYGGTVDGTSGTVACRIKGTRSPSLLRKDGQPFELKRATFSADGKWLVGGIVGGSGYTVHMVKIEGSPDQWKVFDLGLASTEFCRFYYNSPLEDPANDIWEVAWITPDKNKAMAALVDLSSGTPVVGAKRTVADIGAGKWDEFMISGDILSDRDSDFDASRAQPALFVCLRPGKNAAPSVQKRLAPTTQDHSENELHGFRGECQETDVRGSWAVFSAIAGEWFFSPDAASGSK